MPLYEYACPACETRFERLVRAFGEPVSCPRCSSPDVEKQLSTFAFAMASLASAGAEPGFAGGCAREGGSCGCGAGGCGCAH